MHNFSTKVIWILYRYRHSPVIFINVQFIMTTSYYLFCTGMKSSIQVAGKYLNVPVRIMVSVAVVIPESTQPSNHRPDMSTEELSLRALLEGGRYRVPKFDPIKISQSAIVIKTLHVECWSKSMSPWNCLFGIQLSNMHPFKLLHIKNIEINLPATLCIYDNAMSDNCSNEENVGTIYAPCDPPVHNWLDIIPFQSPHGDNSTDLIASGEAHTVLFKVTPKDRCHQSIGKFSADDDSNGDRHVTCMHFAEALYGTVPPPSISGDFVSPVDVRWCEISQEDKLRDGSSTCCSNYMQSTIPVFWELDKRFGSEFVVDIMGPEEGELHKPFTLQVRSNLH